MSLLKNSIITAFSAFSLFGCDNMQQAAAPAAPQSWAVYYGEYPNKQALSAFDMVVLDGQRFDDVRGLRRDESQLLLGYISVGEIHPSRTYHEDFESQAVFLEKNAQWGGNKIDVRSPAWQKYIVHTLTPYILQRGFDGLMLDTIDTSIALEQADPQKFKGMQAATVAIVREMDARYPQAQIVVNRGFELLPRLMPHIDGIIAESILAKHDFATGKSTHFSPDVTQRYATYLQAQQIPIYSLDYWQMRDKNGVKNLYNQQRAYGFVPYVATPDLQTVYDERGKSVIAPPVKDEGTDA